MTARLRRTARSFGVVLAAFWIYRLLFAPWIDPSFVFEESLGASDDVIDQFREADKQRMQKYAEIFPPGSWELDEPIMVESDGVELLMKDYENLPDGKVRLSQCTMLYLQDSGDDASPPRPIILRAPEGAILQFDSALNLKRGKLGKLLGGSLLGTVTIQGGATRAGADDELFIATRDVQMDERKVWSKSRVEFRYGPNFGQGNELVVHLLPTAGNRARGPNVGGFERLELVRDVEMHMQPESSGIFPGDRGDLARASNGKDPAREASDEKRPVDIRCAGPFSFRLRDRMASFAKDVKVFRSLPQGASDRMTCEELQIFFGNRSTAGGKAVGGTNGAEPARRSSLQAERIVARGSDAHPVIIDAPSNWLTARAAEVEYHLAHNRIGVRSGAGQPDATLQWRENRFQGRSLVVERPNPASLPIVSAAGPGWLRLIDPDAPSRNLEASWSRDLNMRPVENSHVVSLVGDAGCKFSAFGQLQAGEIHLWLRETKGAAGGGLSPPMRDVRQTAAKNGSPQRAYPVAPERLLALSNVQFRSAQLSGDTNRLDVRFHSLAAASEAGDRTTGAAKGPNEPNASSQRPSLDAPAAPGKAAVDATNVASSAAGPQAAAPGRCFELHGQRIDADLVAAADSNEFQLNNAAILGQVRCVETRTQNASDPPIDIQGDWLNVQAAATPQRTTVVVKGKPASIAARGMQMIGDEVHLDRGRNLVWIDGRGRMILPARRGDQVGGHAPAAASRPGFGGFDSLAGAPWSIDFAGGMNFDGKTARYERDVVVRSESQTVRPTQPGGFEIRRLALESDTLTAALARSIDFGSADTGQQAEIEHIACPGPITMTQRTGDGRGETAIETLSAYDLSMQQTTGDIHARGPGKYETTRLDSVTPLAGGMGTAPKTSTSKPNTPSYARVEFRGDVTGNSRRGELVLHDDVRGVYGSIERWGDRLEFDPDRIGDGMTFRSDELYVRQTPAAKPSAGGMEVQAMGNTDVDGRSFSARAHKLTYVVGKEQLVLEGDGRSIADLYYQPRAGAPRSRARAGKIEYWRSTGQVNVSDAQLFDIGQIGGAPQSDQPAR